MGANAAISDEEARRYALKYSKSLKVAFKGILAAHLKVANKEAFSAKAKIPKRTLFRMLTPEGNPTLDNIARIVHALSKAA